MTKFGLDSPVTVERKSLPAVPLTLMLDMPPSTNNLFFNTPTRRVKTREYEDWIARNSLYLRSQSPRRMSGPVTILLEFEDCHKRRDLDNAIKPVLDLIADSKHGLRVIDGDHASVVREIVARWTSGIRGVRVTITRATP